jgi:hypothetical protein
MNSESVYSKFVALFNMIYIFIYIYIYDRSWVDTRWQQYITHLHTNSTLTHKQYATHKQFIRLFTILGDIILAEQASALKNRKKKHDINFWRHY